MGINIYQGHLSRVYSEVRAMLDQDSKCSINHVGMMEELPKRVVKGLKWIILSA